MGREFKLGMFGDAGGHFAGLVVGDDVVDLRVYLGADVSVITLLEDWSTSIARLAELASASDAKPLAGLRVLPPIYPPGAFLCAGGNYRRHVIQMTVARRVRAGVPAAEAEADAREATEARAATGVPFVFPGFPGALSVPYDDVLLPQDGGQHDWELELAVVIGRHARASREASALELCRRLHDRERRQHPQRMRRTDFRFTDFVASKLRPTFKPTGPFIVPLEFVPDPHDLQDDAARERRGHAGRVDRRHHLRYERARRVRVAVDRAPSRRPPADRLARRQRRPSQRPLSFARATS